MKPRKKFELVADSFIEEFGIKLFRIRALIAFGSVSKGDFGGYVQKESNVDQDSNAWVSGNARVYDNARVYGDAQVYGEAQVSSQALVYGEAQVSGNARVYGDASIFWASKVGSEQGTLTVFRAKAGLEVTRGCFHGTDSEFLSAVNARHGVDSKIGHEYHLLIEVARSRIDMRQPIPNEAPEPRKEDA